MADAAQIAAIVGGAVGGLVGAGALVERIRGALTSPPRETTLPPPAAPSVGSTADIESVRRLAEGAHAAAMTLRQTTDQMVVRVARLEGDAQEQERILRAVEGNVIRIGERFRVKMEAKRGERDSS